LLRTSTVAIISRVAPTVKIPNPECMKHFSLRYIHDAKWDDVVALVVKEFERIQIFTLLSRPRWMHSIIRICSPAGSPTAKTVSPRIYSFKIAAVTVFSWSEVQSFSTTTCFRSVLPTLQRINGSYRSSHRGRIRFKLYCHASPR
jgi:hypothetical protein